MYPPPPASHPAYGPAYSAPPDPRSSPYGAPPPHDLYGRPEGGVPPPTGGPPPSGDPYAAYYRQHGAHARPQGHSAAPLPAAAPLPGYPPPVAAHPAPASYPPPGNACPGYPPPPDPSYPPPAGYAPPPGDPYVAYAAYPPPVYGAPQLGYPPVPGFPPPPGYYPAPGYGPPPPGYSAPPSSRRDSPRPRRGATQGRSGGAGGRGEDNKRGLSGRIENGRKPPAPPRNSHDPKSRVLQWLQIHSSWVSFWLEGIDPPERVSTSANVSILMLASSFSKKNFKQEFGFMCTVSCVGNKKKEREKQCSREMAHLLDVLPVDNKKAWCQMPSAKDVKRQVEPGDLERLTKLVKAKAPKATVEIGEPSEAVLVASLPWGPHERANGKDPDLAVLDKLDPGFGELFREARRVSGLVRKQWFLCIVWAKPEGPSELKPFPLGVGLATDRNLAQARAVYAAELRVQVFKESMLAAPGGKAATASNTGGQKSTAVS